MGTLKAHISVSVLLVFATGILTGCGTKSLDTNNPAQAKKREPKAKNKKITDKNRQKEEETVSLEKINNKDKTNDKMAKRRKVIEEVAAMQRNMRKLGQHYPTGFGAEFHLYFIGNDDKVYKVKKDDWKVVPTKDPFVNVVDLLNKKNYKKKKDQINKNEYEDSDEPEIKY